MENRKRAQSELQSKEVFKQYHIKTHEKTTADNPIPMMLDEYLR